MKKKILLIRTFKSVGTGGPVPPLELLHIASVVTKTFNGNYELKILDIGIGALGLEEVKIELENFAPNIVCLNSLIWEADLTHGIALLSKKFNRDVVVLVQGQLATLAKEYLLQDENIDYGIIGEADITIVELLKSLEMQNDISKIEGIIYKVGKSIVSTSPRKYIENLDEFVISSSAWDLIDIKKYSRYSNWNGSLKEKFYMPILTSRGCPFDCTFCCIREIFGKQFRARTPENVISEIKFLYEKYHVREFHIFDPVFNYDVERAKKICQLIINSKMRISLAFPHGIRVDTMTEELVVLLKEAGTYKLTYGIETAVPRLQRMIKKNLNIKQVNDVITKTARAGIITGGYFMLGFPTETHDEMLKTVNFAVNSDLNIASFFKVTLYDDAIKCYKLLFNLKESNQVSDYKFEDFSYYSRKRSYAEVPASVLNEIILKAQQRFYFNIRRIWRGLLRFPHKINFFKNTINALGLILQAYLIRQLTGFQSDRNNFTEAVSSKDYMD